jgi:hypothetical protein
MARSYFWLLAVLSVAAIVHPVSSITEEHESGKIESVKPGMHIAKTRGPRISMQTLNDVNRLMKPLPGQSLAVFMYLFFTIFAFAECVAPMTILLEC